MGCIMPTAFVTGAKRTLAFVEPRRVPIMQCRCDGIAKAVMGRRSRDPSLNPANVPRRRQAS